MTVHMEKEREGWRSKFAKLANWILSSMCMKQRTNSMQTVQSHIGQRCLSVCVNGRPSVLLISDMQQQVHGGPFGQLDLCRIVLGCCLCHPKCITTVGRLCLADFHPGTGLQMRIVLPQNWKGVTN